MSTKDCIAALNARLNAQPLPYDGNRKFKRLSKKKDELGRVVRTFADNVHTFKMIGDGPYEILLELDAGTPIPAFATAPVNTPPAPASFLDALESASSPYNPSPNSAQNKKVVGYFQEDEGQFTLVLKGYWDEHESVDPDADLEDLLPAGFSNLADATFEFDGEHNEATYRLREAGFVKKSFTGAPMGEGWYFALGGSNSTMVEQDYQEGVECGFYLVRKSYYDTQGFIDSVHVSDEFPELPVEFEEVMEACFLSRWDEATTRTWLLANGFETNDSLTQMANDEIESDK